MSVYVYICIELRCMCRQLRAVPALSSLTRSLLHVYTCVLRSKRLQIQGVYVYVYACIWAYVYVYACIWLRSICLQLKALFLCVFEIESARVCLVCVCVCARTRVFYVCVYVCVCGCVCAFVIL